ncbi:hypothetical protein [Actinomadura montaniterrae]|uniref:Uncharacterized protein n=1 Tax=Actinomadura montaniterrae TaxID=1803903 RepID=A0A6L3W1V6_9ACTN|nr:hypothetical protein [Actinomadura montaniterrae]KAB2388866.1 hypothetical protein F9B16_02840 [Actinomadura montaniterrae]
MAVFAAAVHSRGEVVLAVHVVTLAALTVVGIVRRRWATIAAGGAGLAVAAGGYLVAAAVNGHVRAELYPAGARDLAENLGARFTTGAGRAWALSGAAGQIWYLAVSTWGLGGVGLAAVVAVLVRRRAHAADRVMAGVLLTVTFGIAYASSAALPDEHRVGNYAYGRYLSCVALVYALAGAAALLQVGLRRAVGLVAAAAAIVGAAGLWVRLYAGERLHTYKFIGFDFPETSFLTDAWVHVMSRRCTGDRVPHRVAAGRGGGARPPAATRISRTAEGVRRRDGRGGRRRCVQAFGHAESRALEQNPEPESERTGECGLGDDSERSSTGKRGDPGANPVKDHPANLLRPESSSELYRPCTTSHSNPQRSPAPGSRGVGGLEPRAWRVASGVFAPAGSDGDVHVDLAWPPSRQAFTLLRPQSAPPGARPRRRPARPLPGRTSSEADGPENVVAHVSGRGLRLGGLRRRRRMRGQPATRKYCPKISLKR